MSGPIRRLLGPTKSRLQTYIAKAKMIFSLPVNNKDLYKEETDLEDLIHRFSSNITLLERCNQDWVTLLHSLKGEEKKAEEKEYLWAADGDEGLIKLLLDSKETVARLEARLVQVLRKGERAKERPLTSGNQFTEPQDNNMSNNTGVKMKLPKLHLPTFEGNILYWQEFWDVYKTAVHEQDISNVTKFSYLKGALRKAAAISIHGISVTSDNYPVAIKILQDKFGKKKSIIEALYSRLQHISMATNRFNDIKYTYEAIEKNLRQLESQDERVDQQRMLVPQILSKFPTEVLVKLEESKKPDENWTVKLLRGSLKRYIDVHENAQRHEFNSRGPIYRGQRSGNSSNQSNQRPIPFVENQGNRPVEAFMVDST